MLNGALLHTLLWNHLHNLSMDPLHNLDLRNFQNDHLHSGDFHFVLGRLLHTDLLLMGLVVHGRMNLQFSNTGVWDPAPQVTGSFPPSRPVMSNTERTGCAHTGPLKNLSQTGEAEWQMMKSTLRNSCHPFQRPRKSRSVSELSRQTFVAESINKAPFRDGRLSLQTLAWRALRKQKVTQKALTFLS